MTFEEADEYIKENRQYIIGMIRDRSYKFRHYAAKDLGKVNDKYIKLARSGDVEAQEIIIHAVASFMYSDRLGDVGLLSRAGELQRMIQEYDRNKLNS